MIFDNPPRSPKWDLIIALAPAVASAIAIVAVGYLQHRPLEKEEKRGSEDTSQR